MLKIKTGLLALSLIGFSAGVANAATVTKRVDEKFTCSAKDAACADVIKKKVAAVDPKLVSTARFIDFIGKISNSRSASPAVYHTTDTPTPDGFWFSIGGGCGCGISASDFGCDWSDGAEHPGCGWAVSFSCACMAR